MARRIIWSLRAQADRKAIFSYWNKHNQSKTYSRKLNKLFKEATIFLSEHPEIGRPTKLENIRVKVVRDYPAYLRGTEQTNYYPYYLGWQKKSTRNKYLGYGSTDWAPPIIIFLYKYYKNTVV